MYIFKLKNSDIGKITVLQTQKWSIVLTQVKNHIHVKIKGPNGFKKQGLSNIRAELNQFEFKSVALYFFRKSRYHYSCGNDKAAFNINNVNYAEVFPNAFD